MEYTVEANVTRRKLNNSRFLSLMESGSSSEASGPESHILKDQNRKDDFSSSTPVPTKLKKKATKTPHLSPINSSASAPGTGIPIAPENANLKGLSLRARAQLKAASKAKAQLSESQKASYENARPDVRGNKQQKNTVPEKDARKSINEVIQPKSGGSKAPVIHSPIVEDEEPDNDNDEDEEPENDNDEDEEPENDNDEDEEPENDNDEDEEPENDNDEDVEPILPQKEPLADGKHFKGVKTIIATGPRTTRNAVSKDKAGKIDSSAKVTSSTLFKLPDAVKRKEPVKGKSSTSKTPNESEKRTLDRPKENRADGEYEAAASNVKKIRTNKSGDHRTSTTAGVGSSGYATTSNLGKNGEVEEISSVDEPAKLLKSKTSKRKSSTPKQIKRLKPGILALREIKKYRRSTELLIKKSPFSRVIREICQNMGRSDIRWAGTALEALQEAAEAYLVTIFEQSYLLTHHAKRVTLMASDMRLLNRLRS